ncbi:hypothetical protein C8Q77DRAFT_227935 [Trametes polyzona]|nr:hypothetical protein C8Q77DRAFT_227935 [Trametes polyzona]
MGRPNFPIDEAYLIGGWLESFTWGVYTTMFFMTLYTIYQKRKEGINKFTTIMLILLYLMATAHIALALNLLINAFVKYRDIMDPVYYLADISNRENMAGDYFYITNLFLGDLIIVWRLYVVWGKNIYIAAIPAMMCLGEFAVGYASISYWLAPKQNFTVMDQLGTTMFALSLATNILLTAVIVIRIWWITSRTKQVLGVSGGSYQRVLLLLIESGAFVAAAKLTEFVLFQLTPDDGIDGLNAIDVVYECMPQITGLVPTVIIYAVNKGYTHQDSYYSGKGQKSTLAFNHTVSGGGGGGGTSLAEHEGTTMFAITESSGASEKRDPLGTTGASSSSAASIV